MQNPKNHFTGKKFRNQETHTNNFSDVFKWMLSRKKPMWPDWVGFNIDTKIESKIDEKIKVTYINHASALIQTENINFITDPIWSKRASPFQFAGPMRIHNPGIEIEKLPYIDIVLISHDHYDHLDIPTIKKLHKLYNPIFICGLKVGNIIKKHVKKAKIIELDWWEHYEFNSIKIHFVPAHHWSSRSLLIKNNTLWGGFVIESKNGNVYFAGDTGWGMHFNQIAQKFKQIKISLLPIGCHEPRWFMKYSHINPSEAVEAHKVLNSELSIALHFNCFKNLADDDFNQAVKDLEKALEKDSISDKNFTAPKPGQEFLI